MKNSSKQYLLLITALFVTFLIGVFIGRIYRPNISVDPNRNVSDSEETGFSYDLTDTRPYIDGKINVNAATADDLMLLPGIGTELANRIVEYRSKNGPFKNIYELTNINGIGDSNLNKIKEYLTVGG